MLFSRKRRDREPQVNHVDLTRPYQAISEKGTIRQILAFHEGPDAVVLRTKLLIGSREEAMINALSCRVQNVIFYRIG